ncbi:Hypothetical predicted protein, partial [Pelobates cultripes]
DAPTPIGYLQNTFATDNPVQSMSLHPTTHYRLRRTTTPPYTPHPKVKRSLPPIPYAPQHKVRCGDRHEWSWSESDKNQTQGNFSCPANQKCQVYNII